MNPPQSPDTIARTERIEAKVVVANEQKESHPILQVRRTYGMGILVQDQCSHQGFSILAGMGVFRIYANTVSYMYNRN